LEKDLVPGLIKPTGKNLHLWSAGCARGEEVYSFKILWERLKERYVRLPELKIIATDLHPVYIDQAWAGIYTPTSLKKVQQEIRDRYFDVRKNGNCFEVKTFLKKSITWKTQDILTGPPGPLFDIIFLRNNLLTYYKDYVINRTLSNIIPALSPHGWLIVGSHENLPAEMLNIMRQGSIPWVYRKEL
jgi:chemotaxis methyl-accepting protein methylase